MDVQEIIVQWLIEHGYDGLYDAGACGCELKDLFPCGGESILYCSPGYKVQATEETEFRRSEGYDFMICKHKEGT